MEIMSGKCKSFFGIVSKAVLAMYPILVLCFLIILKVPIRIFSLFIIAIALFDIIARVLHKPEPAAETRQGQDSTQVKKYDLDFLNSLLLLAMGILGFVINTNIVHKLSPCNDEYNTFVYFWNYPFSAACNDLSFCGSCG